MIDQFESILFALLHPKRGKESFALLDPSAQLADAPKGKAEIAGTINASFLICMAGETHPQYGKAKEFLNRMADTNEWATVVRFYLDGLERVKEEIEVVAGRDSDFANRLRTLHEWTAKSDNLKNRNEAAEKIWSLLFPEAAGLKENWENRIESLRAKRTVAIKTLNKSPITDPCRQILFTSNILLTTPPESKSAEELPFDRSLKERLLEISCEPQTCAYDHPIQVGVEPAKNEVIYGLRGLEEAVEFERERGNITGDAKLTCILSVSVTHRGLHEVAKQSLEAEFARLAKLTNLNVYVFTEADTERLIDEILIPAAAHYLNQTNAKDLLNVFGVDGEYGRHYSFLKAIAPFWSIMIEPDIAATFKIDLDQVFPQVELVKETGQSTFEHFMTPLWGATGVDRSGRPIEFGMIAGALVNEKDIEKSIYMPDVRKPLRPLTPDEYIFFSTLPQALSTEAEMLTRYGPAGPDGKKVCIQRIHVTGGTNGILLDSLRRHRPFTPTFIGRAEDQAYIMSVLMKPGARLAYVHKDGLIMRHDKEAFAQDAIESAYIGKLVGDYARILYFSYYARAITEDLVGLKEDMGPFTGCFISESPKTIVYLRFAMKAATLFEANKEEQAVDFVKNGAERISAALDFVSGSKGDLKQQYEKERKGWDLYYNVLSAIETGLKKRDTFALDLQSKTLEIINQCALGI